MSSLDVPLGFLLSPTSGRSRRVSSNEQPNWNDGNMDMTWLPPGESIEMPLLEGPGIIRHIWFTSHAGGVGELDALSLRIFWDGCDEPAIEAPVGMFFAVGQGTPAPVESVPVQVSPTGSLTCYWPMPFEKSARIVVTNDNPARGTGLYWQVDWEQVDALPPDTPRFCAQYRQEFPAELGRDYLIADLQGSGRFVGAVLAVTLGQDGWFGEGDDFFYIDGEDVPSLQGTGTEDYFNDAWGFRERTGLWFGQPRWQGYSAGDAGVCYRWHVLDPVGFRTSLKVTIEHKGNLPMSEDGFFVERPDFLSSVAFWYQTGAPQRFAELPSYPERTVPWTTHLLLEAYQATRATGSARPSICTEGMFGGRPMLAWSNTELDARLTIPFVVPQTGRHAVRLTALAQPDGGVYDIEVDGSTVLTSHSFCSPESAEQDVALGTLDLEEGVHALTFACTGGPAGPIAIERLRLLRLPPEATRPIRGHNEAHFIRLGIGRALYAYRLAFGKLPASPEALVEQGAMDARYLRDENGAALEWRMAPERVTVVAREWSHSWQGLDARR